jgi:hypothetical protein
MQWSGSARIPTLPVWCPPETPVLEAEDIAEGFEREGVRRANLRIGHRGASNGINPYTCKAFGEFMTVPTDAPWGISAR